MVFVQTLTSLSTSYLLKTIQVCSCMFKVYFPEAVLYPSLPTPSYLRVSGLYSRFWGLLFPGNSIHLLFVSLQQLSKLCFTCPSAYDLFHLSWYPLVHPRCCELHDFILSKFPQMTCDSEFKSIIWKDSLYLIQLLCYILNSGFFPTYLSSLIFFIF